MNIDRAFSHKYLKAADLDGDTKVTITKIVPEKIDDQVKPVVSFQGMDLKLALNKTNAAVISEMYGPETDNWIGKNLVLYLAKVDYAGKRVDAVRVREFGATPGATPAVPPTPAQSNQWLSNCIRAAWNAYKDIHQVEPAPQIEDGWKDAIHTYFGGKPREAITADMWRKFLADGFKLPMGPSPIVDDSFKAEDIPF